MKSNRSSFFKWKKTYLLLPVILCLAGVYILTHFLSPADTKQYHADLLESLVHSDSFSEFTRHLFCYEVTTDSITTAYKLRQPSNYGIPALSPTLTNFSSRGYAKDLKKNITANTMQLLSDKLSDFPKESLSPDEQVTYELLTRYFSLNEQLCHYAYYEELLGNTTGVQANLPVTLAEYPLPDEDSVITYLALLKQIPSYFENVMTYENDRERYGFSTPSFLLSSTAKSLTSLIDSLSNEENCFTQPFDERISQITTLSAKSRETYKDTNRRYVQKYVLPAYRKLCQYVEKRLKNSSGTTRTALNQSQSLTADKIPDSKTSYGLSTCKNGADYYSLLVRNATGSFRPISELIQMTETTLEQALQTVSNVARTEPDAYLYYCDHPMDTTYQTPERILESLSLMIRTDYPALTTQPTYEVKTVPDSMASFLSPAFYMIPAIDDYKRGTIYINPLYTNEENGNLFTTLAHEGFPGHLYQTVYFSETNPEPLRQILDYPGYVEGWATYVELNAFSFPDYPRYGESLCRLYQSDTLINLALCSRIDLGVNYESWTLEDACHLFEKMGFNNYYASDVYTYVVEAPANYLSYLIGYLEIEDLKKCYQQQQKDAYSDLEFHKSLLDIGPADFETIRKIYHFE